MREEDEDEMEGEGMEGGWRMVDGWRGGGARTVRGVMVRERVYVRGDKSMLP